LARLAAIFFNAGEILNRDILTEEASLFPDIVNLSECYIKGSALADDVTGDILMLFIT
jgi:hypothetical protein